MDSKSKKTFNSFYSKEDFYYGLEVRPEFSEYFNDKALSEKVGLDLGCGEGRYAIFLARKGCRVVCVDRSKAGLDKLEEVGRTESLQISPRLKGIADFTFMENSYDIIVAATILDHLDNDLRPRIVEGIKSSLKPGGTLYANVFTVQDPGYRVKKAAPCSMESGDISDTSAFMTHYFEHDELKAMFNGFEIFYYYEGVEQDLSHGSPHAHGWASMLAKKPLDT
ncbi:MAG: methyltransferase domain-containing protein [Deltaproteobacteria bacterium]|nr:methyltransferase domain-containing protein [Deltaproteobacteria bacterium]